MSMQEMMTKALPQAMKAKDTERTGALRILIGEFARQPQKVLTDDQVVSIIKKLIKSEKELLAAKKEESSPFLTIMEGYLPQQAGEEEVRAWIRNNIDFSAFANKMQAMKPIMVHFGTRVDGNLVKKILQQMP